MTYLPPNNLFVSDSAAPLSADTAVANFAPGSMAAAGPIVESSTAKGGSRKRRRRSHETQKPPPGSDDHRFVLDEAKFWEKMLGPKLPDVRWDG